MAEEKLYYMGAPIEELTYEELLEAIKQLAGLLEQQHNSFTKILDKLL